MARADAAVVGARGSVLHPRPPSPFGLHGKTVLLGYDAQELGAVCFLEELDGPGQVEVSLVGVARRLRSGDGAHADEALEQGLDEITNRAVTADVGDVLVQAIVWHEKRSFAAPVRP